MSTSCLRHFCLLYPVTPRSGSHVPLTFGLLFPLAYQGTDCDVKWHDIMISDLDVARQKLALKPSSLQ